jgi:hypothetical protein
MLLLENIVRTGKNIAGTSKRSICLLQYKIHIFRLSKKEKQEKKTKTN